MVSHLVADQEEIVRVLDRHGQWTGQVIARSQLIPQKIYYANVAVWIIHTQSQRVLLELRSKYKKRNPHKWCLVGGHVSVDQTYTAAALNEVKEEVNINIPLEQLRYLCVSYPCKNSRSFTFHYYYFIPQIPAKIKYQKSEVEKIQWTKIDQWTKMVKDGTQTSPNWKKYRTAFTLINKVINDYKKSH